MYADPKKMAARFSSNMATAAREARDAEATRLEKAAGMKDDLAARWPDYAGTPLLRKDAATLRAKAERLRASP